MSKGSDEAKDDEEAILMEEDEEYDFDPSPIEASDEDIEKALLWWGSPRVTHLMDPTDPSNIKALSFVLVDKPTEYSGTHAGAGKGVNRGVRLTDESARAPVFCQNMKLATAARRKIKMGKNPDDAASRKVKRDLLDPCFEYRNQEHLSALIHQAQGNILLRHVKSVTLLNDLSDPDPTFNHAFFARTPFVTKVLPGSTPPTPQDESEHMVLIEVTSNCSARFSLGKARDYLCLRCVNSANAEKFAKHMSVLVEVSRKAGRRMTQGRRDTLGTLLDFMNRPSSGTSTFPFESSNKKKSKKEKEKKEKKEKKKENKPEGRSEERCR